MTSKKVYPKLQKDATGLKFHFDEWEQHFTVRFAGNPLLLLEYLYIKNNKENKIFNSDILELVDKNSLSSDIIYLDPPYNSREYTSNYHLLNLIANYHNIIDPKKYEKWLILWRGQHKDTKFKSDFCKRTTFIDSMRKVITKISWKYVFISHYNWNDNLWNSENNKELFNEIKNMLCDEKIFKKWTFDFRYINRKNFQSWNWLKKENVNEIIFFAEKL